MLTVTLMLPSANNHFIVEGSDMPRGRLAEITAPALVIHGTDGRTDRLIGHSWPTSCDE